MKLNKYNAMRYKHNFLHKIPVCISLMKFSNASTGMVEEMTKEGELNSLHSNETQVNVVGVAPCSNGLSRTAAERKLSGGDYRGWANARYKLTESKTETNGLNKYERKIGSSYRSNRFTSSCQEQAVSKNVGSSLVLQDHVDNVLSPVKHAGLNNSKVCTDSERVVRQLNGSSQEISKDKIARVNGEHVLDANAKDSTNATLPSRARGTDQSKLRDKLCSIYEDILVVDNIPLAEEVAKMLTVKYRHLIHACDTEV